MKRLVRPLTLIAVCMVAAWDWTAVVILALALVRP